MCIAIVCKPGCDVINFKVTQSLSNQAVFSTGPKSRDKNLNISNILNLNKKAFFIIFTGLSIK